MIFKKSVYLQVEMIKTLNRKPNHLENTTCNNIIINVACS